MQRVNGKVSTVLRKAFESSRPAWKVLRVLGNFLHLEGLIMKVQKK